jgi:hypothetical protein
VVGTPVAAYIGPPRGLTKHVSTLGIFSTVLFVDPMFDGELQANTSLLLYEKMM